MPKLDQIIQLLIHPTEFRSVVNYKIWRDAPRDITKPEEFVTSRYDQPTMRKCWDFLDQTSRSFSMVIKELEGDLARVVCLFYLVLRALDTIEDDMTLPNSTKLPLLRSLHLKLYEAGWNFDGSGPNEKDRQVLVEFEVLQAEFVQLDKGYQDVIADIARKMGEGMADFAALATPEKPVAEIDSIEDYDLYCHYVAGLVGEGLSGIFSASGKERDWLAQQLTLSNSMGMLLQKTNIFRDIKEDVEEGRGFWPKAIYGKHGFATMKDLIDPAREKEALFVASEMVLDALRHAVDALDYMTLLKCQSVFNFVSIPAVMAIATLERCFMNPDILKKNVKIRRGEAIRLINQSVNPRDVSFIFRDYAKKIHAKVARDDPNLLKLSIACAKIEQWTEHHYPGFLEISTAGDKPTTNINQYSLDARAKMFTKITASIQSQMAAERRESFLADLRSRGIIKEQTEEEKEASRLRAEEEMNAPFPWLLIVGVIGGLLAVMALMGCGIAYIIWKYAD